MSELLEKIHTVIAKDEEDSEEFRQLVDEFYFICSWLNKKERDKLDVLLGKMLTIQEQVGFLDGAKFGANIIIELLK